MSSNFCDDCDCLDCRGQKDQCHRTHFNDIKSPIINNLIRATIVFVLLMAALSFNNDDTLDIPLSELPSVIVH